MSVNVTLHTLEVGEFINVFSLRSLSHNVATAAIGCLPNATPGVDGRDVIPGGGHQRGDFSTSYIVPF